MNSAETQGICVVALFVIRKSSRHESDFRRNEARLIKISLHIGISIIPIKGNLFGLPSSVLRVMSSEGATATIDVGNIVKGSISGEDSSRRVPKYNSVRVSVFGICLRQGHRLVKFLTYSRGSFR